MPSHSDPKEENWKLVFGESHFADRKKTLGGFVLQENKGKKAIIMLTVKALQVYWLGKFFLSSFTKKYE